MRKHSSVGMLLHFGASFVTALFFTVSSHAGTVTWSGYGDGQSWDDDDNWDPVGQPGSDDDVFHDNDNVIQMNVSSNESSPVIINSFTCDGEEGGGMVIQTGKHLRVNGHFSNSATNTADGYTLTMEPNSTVKLIDSNGAADLRRIRVTLQPVTSGDPSKLVVNGEIIGGDCNAAENCEINAGLSTVDSVSLLSNDWTLSDGADAEFLREMGASPDAPLICTIQGGSRLFVAIGHHTYDTTFHSDQAHQVLYGDGDNRIEMGLTPVALDAPAFELGAHTFIGRLTNTGSLSISTLWLVPFSFFAYEAVREGWDSRNVDIVSPPLDSSESIAASLRLDMISTDFTDWYPAGPVIFLDVPCIGAWRDLVVPDAESEEVHTTGASDEENNSITDDFATTPGQSEYPEVGYFRDVSIGADRTFIFPGAHPVPPVGQTRIFYASSRKSVKALRVNAFRKLLV